MRTLPLSLLIGVTLLTGCTSVPPATNTNNGSSSSAIACTLEAKLCPDGSYVGRSGPHCDFAACPGQSSSASGATIIQSVSDGTITFAHPSNFGLAVTAEQVLSGSYIPACNPGFNYCLYYTGGQYRGTNFESAGFSITKRPDLTEQKSCLNTEPDGYTNITPIIRNSTNYTTSVFAPLGDAAMGHYAHDRVYRLSVQGTCYEFRTRIGATQFANYPAGSIQEFTTSDEATLQTRLTALLESIKLSSGEAILFPAPAGA